jgi:hypothetical protein
MLRELVNITYDFKIKKIQLFPFQLPHAERSPLQPPAAGFGGGSAGSGGLGPGRSSSRDFGGKALPAVLSRFRCFAPMSDCQRLLTDQTDCHATWGGVFRAALCRLPASENGAMPLSSVEGLRNDAARWRAPSIAGSGPCSDIHATNGSSGGEPS